MKRKTITDKTKRISQYAWNCAKLTGLFPEFDKNGKLKRNANKKGVKWEG